MENGSVSAQVEKVSESAFAEKGFALPDWFARSVNSLDRSIDAHRLKAIDYFFELEAKPAFSRFQKMRKELKGLFSGQEVNNLERILAALARMDKEGYDMSRELIRQRAREAAIDNTKLKDFLFFVPEKIPYRDRKGAAV